MLQCLQAINWAWECLTVTFGLDPERLYATYFGGDTAQGLPPDDTAKDIWLKLLPAARVLPFGCKDNFWEVCERLLTVTRSNCCSLIVCIYCGVIVRVVSGSVHFIVV